MEPSRQFSTAMFGVIKRGAVADPLYTLFGPDAPRERVDDCGTTHRAADEFCWDTASATATTSPPYDGVFSSSLQSDSPTFTPSTAGNAIAVLQSETAEGLRVKLQEHVRSTLSSHEYPRPLELVTSLPKTLNGEVYRESHRKAAEDGVTSL
jgi:acetyl-CoA synthetase